MPIDLSFNLTGGYLLLDGSNSTLDILLKYNPTTQGIDQLGFGGGCGDAQFTGFGMSVVGNELDAWGTLTGQCTINFSGEAPLQGAIPGVMNWGGVNGIEVPQFASTSVPAPHDLFAVLLWFVLAYRFMGEKP